MVIYSEKLKRGLDELNIKHTESNIIAELLSTLSSCLDIEEASKPVAKFCKQLVPEASGILYWMDEQLGAMKPVYIWGTDNSMSTFKPNECLSIRNNRAHFNSDSSENLLCKHLGPEQINHSFCVPIVGQGEIIGSLSLLFKQSPQNSVEVLYLQKTAIGYIELGLANIKLRQKLQSQSIRDHLTNLYNRRFFDESLKREVQKSLRDNQPISLLFIDIDFFKKFNDTYGHEAGDEILKQMANLFLKKFRAYDLICRLGGEEFVILLPNTTTAHSKQQAQDLVIEAAETKHFYKNTPLNAITLSIGVASIPDHTKIAENLVDIADKALYQAKNQGRNQVVVYNEKPLT